MADLKKISVLIFTIILSIIFPFQFINNQTAFSKQKGGDASMKRLSECEFIKWFDPDTKEEEGKLLLKNCSECHMQYYKEWKNDKHSMSQNNPFFLSIYKQFKQDLPDKNGNCALCHNPEAAVSIDSVNVDAGIKSNGISCDFCHKIESVDQNSLKTGTAGLKVARAVLKKKIIFNSDLSDDISCEGLKDIRFGPIKNPVQPGKNEELRYNSLYKTSLYCAKCHDGSNGNVQIYSTFTEWVNSPAAKKGVQCQSCHMVPRREATMGHLYAIVDNPNVKHKTRPYHEIHGHSFLTENPHEFRKKYMNLIIEMHRRHVSMMQDEILIVTCKVENNNSGHNFPTGSPMRNAILLVEAKDENGNNLKLIKGERLPNYAGDLRNKPGKLFAKILSETSGEYGMKHSEEGIKFRKFAKEFGIPAQDWWNVFVINDSRIKPNEDDISTYEFAVETPQRGVSKKGTITARLIWRNTWPGLAKLKGVKLEEDLLLEKVISLRTN